MQKRDLGKTGHKSTLVTLGGAIFIYPINQRDEKDFIKYAMDKGINHIDVAPTYGDAEERMGKWVKEYRDNIYLACKTRERTKQEAGSQIRESLKKLQTDYFDLYQFHGLDSKEELNTVFSENGALEAVLEAKEAGLINNVGITSHNPENIMLALNLFDFDTVLLPVNYVLEAHPVPQNDYRPVLELAKEKGIGIIAMKSGAKGPWPTKGKTHNTWYQPFETMKEIEESVSFTLSQPVTTVTSSSDINVAKMMIEAADNFTPMDESSQKRLIEKALRYKPLFPRE